MSDAEWDTWEKQIEEDLNAGRLDKLIKEAEDAHKQGLMFSFTEGKQRFAQAHSSKSRFYEQQ